MSLNNQNNLIDISFIDYSIENKSQSDIDNYLLGSIIYQSHKTQLFEAIDQRKVTTQQNVKRTIKIIQLPNEITENDRKYITRLEMYYNLMKKVENSHVIKVYDTFFVKRNNQNEYWIVMDYCHNKSLDYYFQSDQKDNYQMKICFISDIAIGLEYIYNTDGNSIKTEKTITGNKIS